MSRSTCSIAMDRPWHTALAQCSCAQQAKVLYSACGGPTHAPKSDATQQNPTSHIVGNRMYLAEQVVLFGGCGGEGQLLADFWALDVGKAQWTDLRQEAASLANRFAPPAVLHDNGSLLPCVDALHQPQESLAQVIVAPGLAVSSTDAETALCRSSNKLKMGLLRTVPRSDALADET